MTTRREPETTTARAARSHVEDAVRWALVVGYWTTPLPHRPSRRARATRAQVAEQARDDERLVGVAVVGKGQDLLSRGPAITVASAPPGSVLGGDAPPGGWESFAGGTTGRGGLA